MVAVLPGNTTNQYVIRGYVPATDPFTSNTTLIELSDSTCNLAVACTAAAEAINAPVCNVYAVDMAYCGTEGLVTDRSATTTPVTRLACLVGSSRHLCLPRHLAKQCSNSFVQLGMHKVACRRASNSLRTATAAALFSGTLFLAH